MKKLQIDQLTVETFAVVEDADADLTKTLLDLCTQMTGLCPCTPMAGE
jgi:hypothetical protein